MARHIKLQAMLTIMATPRILIAAVFAFIAVGYGANDALASKRVALVIGNSAYENASTLANPSNDASDMGAALNDLGFDVVVGTDLNNRAMRQKVREFGRLLRGADVAMLFYAGHAMQVGGKNFLAPVDAKLEFESDLDFETIPLSFIQKQMEREAKTILLFLDACRDNPLTRTFQASARSNGAGRGLAEEKLSSSGILIAFATNPGNVALDGKDRNSPFTKAMIDNIRRPGVEISTLMTDVRVQVVRETGGQQTPWINSALLGRFYFNPDDGAGEEIASAADSTESSGTGSAVKIERPKTGSSASVDNARIAAIAWDSVKDSENVDELETFMQVYGSSFYGKLAQIRIDRLKSAQKQTDVAAVPNTPSTTEQNGTPADQQETQVASLEQPDAEKSRKLETNIDPRELARGIQSELARLNCNPGRPDGIWGRRSQNALDSFVRASKVELASASPAPELLDQLQGYDGSGCPKAVRKTCPAGQRLSRKGNCYTPKTKTVSAPSQTTTRSINQPQVQQAQPRQDVFIQNGQQVIIQQPQQPPQGQVIVQQPQQQQPVIVQQPQPVQRPSILRSVIGGAVVCLLGRC